MPGMLDPSQFDPMAYAGGGSTPAWLTSGQFPAGMLSANSSSPMPEPAGSGAPSPTESTPEPPVPGSSLLGRLMNGIGNNSNMLMAMGSGFLGAPSLAQGASRAFAAGPSGHRADISQAVQVGGIQATYTALKKAGATGNEALAAVYNPDIMKQVMAKYGMGPGNIASVTGPNGQAQSVMQSGNNLQTINPATLPNMPPPQAVDTLKKNPSFAGEFDRKYGAGASSKFLGDSSN